MSTNPKSVAALYVRADSVYKRMPGVECYDESRDARTYQGPYAVLCHPPCRLWGRLSHFSTAPESEKELGLHAAGAVRMFGGVLEHPAHSRLWAAAGLPVPGETDAWGGFTLQVNQFAWGHKALKPTWLYFCGISRDDVPTMPVEAGKPTHCITHTRGSTWLKRVTDAERQATPPALAAFLVESAKRTRAKHVTKKLREATPPHLPPFSSNLPGVAPHSPSHDL